MRRSNSSITISFRTESGAARRPEAGDSRPRFASLQRELLPDLLARGADFGPGTHSLGQALLRRNSFMMFT